MTDNDRRRRIAIAVKINSSNIGHNDLLLLCNTYIYQHTNSDDPTWKGVEDTPWKLKMFVILYRSRWPTFVLQHNAFHRCTNTPTSMTLHEMVLKICDENLKFQSDIQYPIPWIEVSGQNIGDCDLLLFCKTPPSINVPMHQLWWPYMEWSRRYTS